MAEPVAAPSNRLLQNVYDLNRRRATDWGRFGAAVVPTFNAGLQGGQAAAEATARGYYPTPQKPQDPVKAMEVQAKIVDALSKNQLAVKEGAISSFQAALKDRDSLRKAILENARGLYGDYASAQASVASSSNSATAKLAGDYVASIEKQLAAAGTNAAGVRASFEKIRTAMQQAPNDPATGQLIYNELSALGAGGDGRGAQAGLLAMLETAAPGSGHPTFNHYLAGLANTGDPYAMQANDLLKWVGDEASRLGEEAVLEIKGTMAGAASSLQRGVRGPQMGVDLIDQLWAKMEPGMGPEDMMKQMQDVLGGAPNTPNPTQDAMLQLLRQLDNPNLPPASNLAEARRRMLEDPEFKAWMAQNGYSDPATALHELRKIAEQKRHQNKQADRQLTRERRMSGIGPNSGPEMAHNPASSLVAGSGRPGPPPAQATAKLEPSFVWGPQGLMFYTETGELRPATEDEIAELDAEMTKDQQGALSMVSTDFQKYHDAFISSAESEAKALQPQADQQQAARAASPSFKAKGPTPGMVAHEVGYSLAHPGQSLTKLESAVRQVPNPFKKKVKKPEEEEETSSVLP